MAVFLRVDESHHGAVEGLTVIGAETVGAAGAIDAGVPRDGGSTRLDESDAERHDARNGKEKVILEN
jgi:hypothetical protein